MRTRTPSANAAKKAKTWELATIRRGKSQEGKEYSYVVFSKDVEILVKGQPVDLGEFNIAYINDANKMLEDIDYKASQGWITEEAADKAAAAIEEKNIKGSIKVNLKG